MEITINESKNGIEIRFEAKPKEEILSQLKYLGFKWSNSQKMWYVKQSMEILNQVKELAHNFDSGSALESHTVQVHNKSTQNGFDLWEATRTDNIENNFAKYRIYDCKEIAAIIRKHIKSRFPMCKFSVTSSYNHIDVDLLSSPFARGSDELNAIVHYVYKFAQSYNYDNSDSMSDYFDVNFYGVYESSIVSYKYQQTEMTDEFKTIYEMFQEKKVQFEHEERQREEEKLKEYIRLAEVEKIERAKREEERKSKHTAIENNAIVNNVSFFVMNCYDQEDKENRCNCKITRVVDLSKELFDMFMEMRVSDFSFFEHMGGTHTDDLRINSFMDYDRMSAEERKTVEFYNTDCVAIRCDGELKIVVDPQGHNYAKYIYLVDDISDIVPNYITYLGGISSSELAEYRLLARTISDISTRIIEDNGWHDSWNSMHNKEFRNAVKKWIYDNNFKFSVGVVRAITDEQLKEAMYRLITEVDGIYEQFERSKLEPGQRITIIQMSDFGGVTASKVVFKSYTLGKYAQYDNAVKMVFRPERKRNDYYKWFYRDVIIVDGWIDLPDNLFWDVYMSNGIACKKTKFLSCDNKQYDVVLEYLKENNLSPIINTYKPQW